MDFGSFGVGSKGSSMRRKQSNVGAYVSSSGHAKVSKLTNQSLLQALSKSNSSRVSAMPIPASAARSQSSTSHSDESHGTLNTPYSPDDSFSSFSHSTSGPSASRATSISTANGGRSVSGSAVTGLGPVHGTAREVKKVEDVIGLAKDRLLNWSYLMQWYGGDTHWLNTVKVRRELVEKELGPGKLDQRSRQYFILGTSLAMLFDITVAGDFLRALQRLLDEWEYYCEKGAKGVKSLFKSQKGKREKGELLEAESYLVFLNLPFTPDFFAVHATTCSVIRDIYKKMLGMLLPNIDAPLPANTAPPAKHLAELTTSSPSNSFLHPSTFIVSAPTEMVLRANPQISLSLSQMISHGAYRGETESIHSTPTTVQQYGGSADADASWTAGRGGRETPYGESAAGLAADNGIVQRDAFEAFINGELPPTHSLVGDGQQITPQVIDTFVKVDAKLKRQFNLLVKEGDQFARKMLDEEIAHLLTSLTSSQPMSFDYDAALSGVGNGWQPSPPRSAATQYHHHPPSPSTASTANFSTAASSAGGGHFGSLSRRHPGMVRQGSSDRSQDQHSTHPWARAGGDGSEGSHERKEVAGSMEEHMKDEDPEERRERDFGTV